MKKKLWFESVLQSLAGMSRTLNGVSDTSSAVEKPKLEVEEGSDLIRRSSQNLQYALEYLWENQSILFTTPIAVRAFIDSLARIVSDGLLQSGQSFYRIWVTKFGHTLPEDIEVEYQKFCEWLCGEVESGDPVAVAALVEKRLDGKIHPFADGCGRTAKILAAFILLRQDIIPPRYPPRKEYYAEINKGDESWIEFWRDMHEKGV